MPTVKANGISMHYEQQGSGEPLILVPFLTADHACYAFQVAEYAKHFTCILVDLRGTGESQNPDGNYSTETLADDVAALMDALGVRRAHVAGLSLGAAIGMWLAAKYSDKVQSLSLHSGWTKTDPFIKTVIGSWQMLAKALDSVPEMVVAAIFPWCFTPELYAAKPEYIDSLAGFIRSRPKQAVSAFLQQSNAVITHDVSAHLGKIKAPTQITFGDGDLVTSTRFADEMKSAIRGSELLVWEKCAHAPLYEKVEEFNHRTLDFLRRHPAAA
jgi:pimeloyl-ACP methyl ester carboxylesterase